MNRNDLSICFTLAWNKKIKILIVKNISLIFQILHAKDNLKKIDILCIIKF